MEIKKYSVISNTLYWIRYYYRKSHILIWMCLLQILMGSLAPLIGIYLPKLTLDMVTEGVTAEKFIQVIGLLALLMTLFYALNSAVSEGKYWIYNSKRGDMLAEIFLKSQRIKYSLAEDGAGMTAYQEALEVATNGDWSASSRTFMATISLCTDTICFVLYSAVLGNLSLWMIAILIGLSLLNCLWISLNIKYQESVREDEAHAGKRYYCVKSAMGDTAASKDVRIFGMNKWLTDLMDRAVEDSKRLRKKIQDRNSIQEIMGFLTGAVRDLAAYAYLIYMASRGNIDVGEFVLYFGAVTGFSGFVNNIVSNIGELRQAGNSTNYYRSYMELPDEELTEGESHIRDLERPLAIEFKNVSFAYGKGKDRKSVFEGLNLFIRAGERLALVGVNGAGKTTLVKLLCGMYEPDEGQILINGTDIRSFPKGELYSLFSAVFQEQLIFPFSLAENIAMTTRERADDKRVMEAVNKAGLKHVAEKKGLTPDTYILKTIAKAGVELSGGEKQRLILARALYKDGAIMVLDEPTAALDPIAESEIYESYNKFTQGKTAIFISHRLASTRFSDRIVFLKEGRIIEEGSHEELMALGGEYAEMYEIQSNYYKEEA